MAGTIEELNFSVILDDKEFNNKIKNDINLAKEFNVQLSKVIELKSRISNVSKSDEMNAKRLSNIAAQQAVNEEKVAQAKIKTAQQQERLNKLVERGNRSLSSQHRIMGEIANAAAGIVSIYTARNFLSSLVRVTGEFETQRVALRSILGDAEGADRLYGQIKELAVISPFQFSDLTTYSKQLSAYSVPLNEIFDTTKMLADVSAGLGVGMDRLILAYGQVRSAAFLRGQEVRQFTEAGIPILDELAKQFTEVEGRAVSVGEVFDKISSRLVPFEMVEKVFKNLTSEGGKFYKMQEVLAETLTGKISNLKDAYEIMLSEIGEANSGILKGTVGLAGKMVENYETVGGIILSVTSGFGGYAAVLALVWAREKVVAVSGMVSKMLELSKHTNVATAAMRAFGIAGKAAVGGVVGLVAALATGIILAVRHATELRRELDGITDSKFAESNRLERGLDELVGKLKNAVQGSQNYRDAITALNSKYGDYLPHLITEKDSLNDIERAANAAAEAIRNKAKANAYEKGIAEIEDKKGGVINTNIKELVGRISEVMPDASEVSVNAFVANLRKVLEKTDKKDVRKAFYETAEGFFGDDATALHNPDVEASVGFLAKAIRKYNEAEESFLSTLDIRFQNTAYSTAAEADAVSRITEEYERGKEALNGMALGSKELNAAMKNLDVERLKKLIDLYGQEDFYRPDLVQQYTGDLDKLTKELEGWQGKVAKVLKGFGVEGKGAGDMGLWAEDTTSMLDYIDDLRKSYKSLEQDIKDIEPSNPVQAEQLKSQKKAIEEISKALGFQLKLETKTEKTKKVSREQKAIENDIRNLKTLYRWYQKFSELGQDDNSIRDLFKGLFPDVDTSVIERMDFKQQIIDKAKELEKYDKGASEKVLVDIGADAASTAVDKLKEEKKEYEKLYKAAQRYYEKIIQWAGEDFNLSGTGIGLDINKIVSDYNSEISKIEQKADKITRMFNDMPQDESSAVVQKLKTDFTEEFGEDAWTEFWDSYVKGGLEAIKKLEEAEKASQKVIAQDKLTDLADRYVKDSTSDLNLGDWGDKSLRQVINISKSLRELMNTDVELPPSLVKSIEDAGLSLSDFQDAVKEGYSELGKDVDDEKLKKIASIGKIAADQLFGIADAYAKLVSESEGGDSATATAIEGMGSFVSSVASGAASGGAIGAIIAGVGNIAQQVLNGVAEANARARELEQKAEELRRTYEQIENDRAVERHTTIFGTDEFGAFVEQAKIAEKSFQKIKESMSKGMELPDLKLDNIAFNKNFRQKFDELGSNAIVSDMRTGWQKAFGTGLKNIKTVSLSDFIDEDGMLKGEELQAWYEQYGEGLSEENQKIIEEMLYQWGEYEKAQEEMMSYLASMFDGLASDIVDSMVDSFVEIGDATANLEESFESLGETILKSFMKSHIMTNILNKYQKEIEDLYNKRQEGLSDEEFAKQLGDITGRIKIELKDSAAYYEDVMKAFQESGLLRNPGEDEDGNLANGIKNITEDTANLLASYLNAIRADVSYGKYQREMMMRDFRNFINLFPSSPKLVDYLAQIQANTYDTAVLSREILSELRSVIGTGSDGSAVKVLM